MKADWGERIFVFRRNLHRRRSSKHEGQIGTVVSMFFLLMLLVVGMYQIYLWSIRQAKEQVEDALAAAELSCAVIDIERFGRTHEIVLPDPEKAFRNFWDSFCENLSMDEDGRSTKGNLQAGPVRLLDFRIYNVDLQGITVYCFDRERGLYGTQRYPLESMKTPDGTEVTTTTIYGKAEFYVKGFSESVILAQTEKSVDITVITED